MGHMPIDSQWPIIDFYHIGAICPYTNFSHHNHCLWSFNFVNYHLQIQNKGDIHTVFTNVYCLWVAKKKLFKNKYCFYMQRKKLYSYQKVYDTRNYIEKFFMYLLIWSLKINEFVKVSHASPHPNHWNTCDELKLDEPVVFSSVTALTQSRSSIFFV